MNSGPPKPSPFDGADRGLPREGRLRRRVDFDRVMQNGRKVVHPALVVWVQPSPAGVDRPRLGLAVSRKVGNAPIRNRVKRVLRAAFGVLSERRPEPLDVVVVARPGSAPLDRDTALRALIDVLDRAARPRPPRKTRAS